MKKSLTLLLVAIAIIMMLTQVRAASSTISTNATYYQNVSHDTNSVNGIVFAPLINRTLSTISRTPFNTAPFCIVIRQSDNVTLVNSTWSNNMCNANLQLVAGQKYNIGSGANSTTYREGFNNTFSLQPSFYPFLGNFTSGCFGDNCATQFPLGTVYGITNLTMAGGIITLLKSPIDGDSDLSDPLLFNASFLPLQDRNLTNASLYIWNLNGTLRTFVSNIVGGNDINSSNWSVSGLESTTYIWNVLACSQNNTGVDCGFAQSNNTIYHRYEISSETYNNISTEGSIENFVINLTVSQGLSLSSANLFYNNTYYTGLIVQPTPTTYSISRSLSTPNVLVGTNINFIWILNFNDGSSENTTARNQTVNPLSSLIVSTSCTDRAYRFDFQDEENFTLLNNVTINYNFGFGINTTITPKETYGNITASNFFYVCINSTQSPNWRITRGEIQYGLPGYVDRRYYVFNGTIITNQTQNVTLYSLLSSLQTSFREDVLSSASLRPFVGKYTALLRWYPNLNQYKVVEMGQTDDTGSTVIHVVTEDVDYRVAVYETNGTLLKLANPVRMICLENPCTYTVKIEPDNVDYSSFLNVQYTLTFNQTTGIWLFTYSDSTQRTDLMNLTIYRDTGSSSYPICSTSSSAYTGVITCNTSTYLSLGGRQRAVITRTASPPVILVVKIYDILNSALNSSYGLWLTFLIAVPVIFFFCFISPVAAIIGGVIALLPALYFGAVNIGIIGGIAVLGGIIAHFLKRVG